MFDVDDSCLHEEDFLYVPEFRSYLESYKKANGTGLSRKTINRHMTKVMDFLYCSSTHNYNVDTEGPDEVPIDIAFLKRGNDYFSSYFDGWLLHNYESEDSIRQSVTSVKKFYRFLMETGRIESAVADDILEELKEY